VLLQASLPNNCLFRCTEKQFCLTSQTASIELIEPTHAHHMTNNPPYHHSPWPTTSLQKILVLIFLHPTYLQHYPSATSNASFVSNAQTTWPSFNTRSNTAHPLQLQLSLHPRALTERDIWQITPHNPNLDFTLTNSTPPAPQLPHLPCQWCQALGPNQWPHQWSTVINKL